MIHLNLRKIKSITFSLILSSFMVLCYGMQSAHGFWIKDLWVGDLEVGGYFKNETSFHLHTPNEIMKFQNQFNLELNYNVTNFLEPSSQLRFFLNFRPEYDAVFDMTNDVLGGSGHKNRDHLQDNFGRNDDWNPLLREAWVQIKHKGFDFRLGRQIVVWGRTDGLKLLDFINPMNYRELIVDEYEDAKIPIWMLNFKYWFDAENGFQFIYIPRYVPDFNAPLGSPWAFRPTKFVQGTLVPMLKGFGFKIKHYEPGQSFNKGEYAFRWKGKVGDWWYTLNYFYTWDDIPDLVQKGRYQVFKPDRLGILGGSFDKAFDRFLWMDNWIFRGECAWFHNDNFLNQDSILKERDHFELLFGFDKYFFVDYWVSMQWFSSYLIHPSHEKYLGPAMSYIDNVENYFTFMLQKFYIHDRLLTEVMFVYTDDGGSWLRPRAWYEITDRIKATIGFNLFNGSRYDFLGQFYDQDQIFFEIKYGF